MLCNVITLSVKKKSSIEIKLYIIPTSLYSLNYHLTVSNIQSKLRRKPQRLTMMISEE